MGIYDRCEKDVKNCRQHSLKPEEGLLTIDKDFLCLSDTKGDKIIKTMKMLDRCT